MAEANFIRFRPGPITTKCLHDVRSRVKLMIGPFGTGKTTAAAWDLIDFQSERILPSRGKKRCRHAVVRNTYPELRDTTVRTYLDWFPEAYFGKYVSSEKRYVMHLDGDREVEILFKALDSAEDVRDLLSMELSSAHVDEAREVHEDIIKGLLGRIGRFPALKDCGGEDPFLTPPQLILTSNYPATSSHLYKNFVKNPIDGWSIYELPQSENKHNLRTNYYEDLEKDYADRPDLLKTLVRGEWGVTVRGARVYPEFSRKRHVAPGPVSIPPLDKVIRGWDNTGLWPAAVITGFNAAGQWLVFHEIIGRDIGIEEFAQQVLVWSRRTFGSSMSYRDIGDPAAKSRDSKKMSPQQYMRRMGIRLENGIQTFKTRREAVAGRLSRSLSGDAPSILIDPRCETLVDGMDGGYAFPEIGNTGVYGTEPQDNIYTHVNDALQYPATRLFITDSPIVRKSVSEIMRSNGSRTGFGWG